jgi:hypothetical protein
LEGLFDLKMTAPNDDEGKSNSSMDLTRGSGDKLSEELLE